jgi:hypothetical protein
MRWEDRIEAAELRIGSHGVQFHGGAESIY